MIIALSIFTLLSAAMAVVLSSALSAYRLATNKNEAMLQAKTAMEWLVRDIQPPSGIGIGATDILVPNVINVTVVGGGWVRYYLDVDTIKRIDSATGQNNILAEGVTRFDRTYYDAVNTVTTIPANVRVVEIYITATRNGQNFEGYTTARFLPSP